VSTDSKPGAGAFLSKNGRMITGSPDAPSTAEPAAPTKKPGAAKQKATLPSNTGKVTQRPPASSRAASKAEKLVCRYCGSDDLAPSFKERRDARCRACFKKRYGSARGKKAQRARKVKAAK
jgi:hypothetical protein